MTASETFPADGFGKVVCLYFIRSSSPAVVAVGPLRFGGECAKEQHCMLSIPRNIKNYQCTAKLFTIQFAATCVNMQRVASEYLLEQIPAPVKQTEK